MCLRVRKSESERIAEEDIPCVKNLAVGMDGRYYTPFIGKLISRVVLSGIVAMRACGEEFIEDSVLGDRCVGEGFIHVFTSLDDALKWGAVDGVFYECIIPKGTRYWVSSDGKEYASKRIRFKRRVDIGKGY